MVFFDNFDRLSNILENVNSFPFLKLIVHFDKLTGAQAESLNNFNLENVNVMSYNDLMVKLYFIKYIRKRQIPNKNGKFLGVWSRKSYFTKGKVTRINPSFKKINFF